MKLQLSELEQGVKILVFNENAHQMKTSIRKVGLSRWPSGPTMQDIQEMQVQPLGWEDPLEEGMASHSTIPSWRIPWIGDFGRL